MGEVTALFGDSVPTGEPRDDVVALLEDVLAKARLGEVRSMALVWIDGGDGIHREWKRGDKFNSQVLGSITDLQWSFVQAWNEVSG